MSLAEESPESYQQKLIDHRLALSQDLKRLSSIICAAQTEYADVIQSIITVQEELSERWHFHLGVHQPPDDGDRCDECPTYDPKEQLPKFDVTARPDLSVVA